MSGRLFKKKKFRDEVAVQSSSSALFSLFPTSLRDGNLQQTATDDVLVQGATSCVTTSHTQLLSGNIGQSGCMVMSGGRESGSGSGMGAIRLENGELDSEKERRMDRKDGGRNDREVKPEGKGGKVREAVIETVLGPGRMMTGIPAVRGTRRHLL